MARTVVRSKDKSSAVRRRALQLASAMLARHPYRVGDGQLNLSAIEAAYAKVADELDVRFATPAKQPLRAAPLMLLAPHAPA